MCCYQIRGRATCACRMVWGLRWLNLYQMSVRTIEESRRQAGVSSLLGYLIFG